MRTCWQIPLAAAAASLLAGGAFAAQPPTPADLQPCAFTLPEVALLASGFVILAWSAALEAGQIARLQSL